MSRVVKSGVAAGIESLLEFGARAPIDAIITATGLGCIADSEKFLDGLIAGNETMLNPTDVYKRQLGYISALTGIVKRPELKGALDRRKRLCLPQPVSYTHLFAVQVRSVAAGRGRERKVRATQSAAQANDLISVRV